MGKSRGNQSTFRIDIQRALGAIYAPSQFVQAPVTQFQEIQRTQEYPTCPTGYYMSGNRCVPVPPCPRGQVFSVISGRCEQSYVAGEVPNDGNAICKFSVADPDTGFEKVDFRKIKYNTSDYTAVEACKAAGAKLGSDCMSGNCCYTSSQRYGCHCQNSSGEWKIKDDFSCCSRACSDSEKKTILGS